MACRFFNVGVRFAIVLALLLVGSGSDRTNAQGASPRCAPYPSFPDANCTGILPGVTRTPTGSITTTQDGQIIQNLDVSGSIMVAHANVLIRNVKVSNPNGVAIFNVGAGSASSYTLEDCELDGAGNLGADSSNNFFNITMRRCKVFNWGEGPGCTSGLFEDNYMYNFVDYAFTGAHQDGIQCEFASNVIIRHNTILMNLPDGNAAIVIGNQPGNSNNLIEQNLLGGGGYALQLGGEALARNNHFTTTIRPNSGNWGPIFIGGNDVTLCGNRWHDCPNGGQYLSGQASCVGTPSAPSNLRILTN